jgi:uracil-DNA glycosylase family 4
MDKEDNWTYLTTRITTCRLCPRLVSHRETIARIKRRAYQDWDYWAKPVPGFGDQNARLLVVGLAPGAHGSNRTGRMFTGDGSGSFLFPALFREGFASQPDSIRIEDGLELRDIFITAVCRCAPPENKPLPQELANCRQYLLQEIDLLEGIQGVVTLGAVAYKALLSIVCQKGENHEIPSFGHGVSYEPGNGMPWILASYHPSLQNTQTGRLTEVMFDNIWKQAHLRLK